MNSWTQKDKISEYLTKTDQVIRVKHPPKDYLINIDARKTHTSQKNYYQKHTINRLTRAENIDNTTSGKCPDILKDWHTKNTAERRKIIVQIENVETINGIPLLRMQMERDTPAVMTHITRNFEIITLKHIMIANQCLEQIALKHLDIISQGSRAWTKYSGKGNSIISGLTNAIPMCITFAGYKIAHTAEHLDDTCIATGRAAIMSMFPDNNALGNDCVTSETYMHKLAPILTTMGSCVSPTAWAPMLIYGGIGTFGGYSLSLIRHNIGAWDLTNDDIECVKTRDKLDAVETNLLTFSRDIRLNRFITVVGANNILIQLNKTLKTIHEFRCEFNVYAEAVRKSVKCRSERTTFAVLMLSDRVGNDTVSGTDHNVNIANMELSSQLDKLRALPEQQNNATYYKEVNDTAIEWNLYKKRRHLNFREAIVALDNSLWGASKAIYFTHLDSEYHVKFRGTDKNNSQRYRVTTNTDGVVTSVKSRKEREIFWLYKRNSIAALEHATGQSLIKTNNTTTLASDNTFHTLQTGLATQPVATNANALPIRLRDKQFMSETYPDLENTELKYRVQWPMLLKNWAKLGSTDYPKNIRWLKHSDWWEELHNNFDIEDTANYESHLYDAFKKGLRDTSPANDHWARDLTSGDIQKRSATKTGCLITAVAVNINTNMFNGMASEVIITRYKEKINNVNHFLRTLELDARKSMEHAFEPQALLEMTRVERHAMEGNLMRIFLSYKEHRALVDTLTEIANLYVVKQSNHGQSAGERDFQSLALTFAVNLNVHTYYLTGSQPYKNGYKILVYNYKQLSLSLLGLEVEDAERTINIMHNRNNTYEYGKVRH